MAATDTFFFRPFAHPASNHLLIFLLCTIFSVILLLPTAVHAHGCMNTPNQRGVLAGGGKRGRGGCASRTIDMEAPMDYKAHFPAGPRSGRKGAGVNYQKSQAGPFGWVPFTPLNSGFRWRSGVCGDVIGRREDHRKGGKYFYNGKIAATYIQGGLVDIGVKINAHHNGFMELHICDARKCNGDISMSCFRKGHCHRLNRAPHRSCDSGHNRYCGPIDRKYPGRWYLPCSIHPPNSPRTDNFGIGGRGFIRYRLPNNFATSHAVLHWYWTAASICNPPGVVEYFTGRDRPRNWGKCKGQASARGGYVSFARPCRRNLFPEEYLQCADVRVMRKGQRARSPFPWSKFSGRFQANETETEAS